MARQKQVKARKDYPNAGITKGDLYWIAHMKTGPRSSKTIRSLTKIPRSRLTTSAYRGAVWSAEDTWSASPKSPEDAHTLCEALREAASDAGESFDNMPEGLQQGDTGQLLESRRDECESIADEVEQQAEEMSGLDRNDYESDEDFDQARNDLVEEIDRLIGDIPE